MNIDNNKMELEEAKNNLKKLIELRKNKCGEIKFDTCICGTKDLEIVLQALENSISKDIVRQKINERQFELQQEYKDFKDDIRLNTLQEIYYAED